MIKKIWIEGMSCGHCVKRVETALKELEGVTAVVVDLKGKFAKVEVSKPIEKDTFVNTIDDAGYDVLNIEDIE